MFKSLPASLLYYTDKLYIAALASVLCGILKGLSYGILSFFEHRKKNRSSEGNLKITLYKDSKTSKR